MRVPITLIIDDPAPIISVYREHSAVPFTKDGRALVPTYSNDLLFDFCDVIEKYGIKGKFSVVPMPGNKGDIINGIEGVEKSLVDEWLETVRARVAPKFSIGPEILSHHKAVDLLTGKALDVSEKIWAMDQDRTTLTPYISKALSLLKEAGFDAFGVTSPWDFGITVEDEYVAAISQAVYDVTGKSNAWYFLRALRNRKNAKPWVAYFENGRTVVSIPATTTDVIWQTIDTVESSDEYVSSVADKLITEDGSEGEIIRVIDDGGYPILVTHWQSLMSNGSGTGIRVLAEVARRIALNLSDKVEWKSFEEIMNIVVNNKEQFPKLEF